MRIALFGAGHLGKIHLKCILATDCWELAGFYEPDDKNAASAETQYGAKRFHSIEQLLEEVDAVDIVTPTPTHYELAAMAMRAGGLAKFTHWDGPTFTDSGGFQVLSLGSGYKKTLSMDIEGVSADDVIAPRKERQAWVDQDGVDFKSYLDGSMHRFTPEHSMQIQHGIGADICFAFDELTSLMDDREYQETSMRTRTQPWAERSLVEMQRLRLEHPQRPYQAVFGVLQGANYKDLRQETAAWMGARDFDGYGIGRAMVRWR